MTTQPATPQTKIENFFIVVECDYDSDYEKIEVKSVWSDENGYQWKTLFSNDQDAQAQCFHNHRIMKINLEQAKFIKEFGDGESGLLINRKTGQIILV